MCDELKKEGAIFNIEILKANLEAKDFNLPIVGSANIMPEKLVSFNNYSRPGIESTWVHFYVDDSRIERLWKNPMNYFPRLKESQGVISPDFSVYRNMPPLLQEGNIYRNRAMAIWLSSQGIKVIPNIRWGDINTFKLCFKGIEHNSVLAVGNHGCYATDYDKQKFKEGVYRMIDTLHPSGIVLYGTLPEDLSTECKKSGIELKGFKSEFAISRERFVKNNGRWNIRNLADRKAAISS